MSLLRPLISAIAIEVRRTEPRLPCAQRDSAKQGLLGRLAAHLIPGLRRRRVSADDLRSAEFRTSTQHMGVRFTDRIRDTFRFRWLRRR